MNNAALPKTAKPHPWPKRIAIALAIALVAGTACFGVYVSDYYRAQDTPALLSDAKAVSVEENDESIAIAPPGSLEGESSAEAGLILYPGAKVDPHAYVPLAEKIAERGYICVIAKMPFNLAFFWHRCRFRHHKQLPANRCMVDCGSLARRRRRRSVRSEPCRCFGRHSASCLLPRKRPFGNELACAFGLRLAGPRFEPRITG